MKNATFQVLFAGVAVAGTLLLDLAFSFLSDENLVSVVVLAAVVLLFSSAVNALFYRQFAHPKVLDELNQIADKARALEAELRRSVEIGQRLIFDREQRIFSTWPETEAVEETADEVWVLTIDFYWDLQNTKYSSMVKDKIKLGHRYWWLYPEKERGSAEDLRTRLQLDGQSAEQVCFTPISNSAGDHFPHDVVIYNPRDDSKRIVFICDVNGMKRDSPKDSIDLPIKDANLGTRYCRLFCELAAPNRPAWHGGSKPSETLTTMAPLS